MIVAEEKTADFFPVFCQALNDLGLLSTTLIVMLLSIHLL